MPILREWVESGRTQVAMFLKPPNSFDPDAFVVVRTAGLDSQLRYKFVVVYSAPSGVGFKYFTIDELLEHCGQEEVKGLGEK